MAELNDCEEARRKLLDYENSDITDAEAVSELLSCMKFPSLAALIGDTVARLAREESFRDEASKSQLPEQLLQFLTEDDLDTRLQILRASGNLCIDHDVNREKFWGSNACKIITDLISKCVSSEEGSSNLRYKLVLCGCLLNMSASSDNGKLADTFVNCGTLQSLSHFLLSEHDERVREMGLKALSALCDSEEVKNTDSSKLTDLLIQLAISNEVAELSIEIIESVVKKGEEKILLQLVGKGLVQHLLSRNDDYYQKSVDIVVLILGNDSCMKKLYENSDVLSLTKEWLQSPEQRHMANAAIIVANFARSDANCTALVKNGYVQLLLPLTKIEESKEYEGKLHFAVLSALRNLSIPSDLKLDLFSLGVADVAIHCLKTSSFPHIHFKSLGILRLLVQNQSNICSSVAGAAMEQIISATQNTSTSHVHIEAGRLLAGIVKYCSERDVLEKVVASGGLELVYDLVQSTEPVLIGEGLIAMNIIACIPDDKMYSAMIKTIEETFMDCLCSKLNSKSSLNILNNSLVLLTTICSKESEMKTSLLSTLSIQKAIQELLSHDNDAVRSKAEEINSLLIT